MLTWSFEKIDNPMCLTETEIQPKPINFQLFQSVSVENFTNRKFQFRLAKTKKTDRTKLITPLIKSDKILFKIEYVTNSQEILSELEMLLIEKEILVEVEHIISSNFVSQKAIKIDFKKIKT